MSAPKVKKRITPQFLGPIGSANAPATFAPAPPLPKTPVVASKPTPAKSSGGNYKGGAFSIKRGCQKSVKVKPHFRCVPVNKTHKKSSTAKYFKPTKKAKGAKKDVDSPVKAMPPKKKKKKKKKVPKVDNRQVGIGLQNYHKAVERIAAKYGKANDKDFDQSYGIGVPGGFNG